jgi:hypothetical protein
MDGGGICAHADCVSFAYVVEKDCCRESVGAIPSCASSTSVAVERIVSVINNVTIHCTLAIGFSSFTEPLLCFLASSFVGGWYHTSGT